jgi:hypothetical protein
MIHGFAGFLDAVPAAAETIEDIVAALRRTLADG